MILSSLTGCVPSHYPHLADVPDYTPPSVSPEEAKKEIEELKAERATHIPK